MDNQIPATQPPSIVRTTPRVRLLLAIFLILILTFFLICQFVVIPFMERSLNILPQTNLGIIKIILVAFTLIALLAGLGTIWYGRKIIRSGQYPLENAWVWRDTPVKHGRHAIKLAWAHIAIGIIICMIGVSLPPYLWRLIDQPVQQFRLLENIPAFPIKPNADQ